MKHETSIIYSKYSYFLILLFDQRDYLFNKFDDELSFEIFFEKRNYVINLHREIKTQWKKYNQNRFQIMKKFEYGKYEIILRPYFCRDIKNVILSFLFA